MTKKQIVLPVTLADVQFELEAERDKLSAFLSGIAEDVKASLAKTFNAAGGCKTCWGRGWIVVWDTMDMMDGSCAEFGSCTNPTCTEESRKKSGLHPRHSKYDARHGIRDPLGASEAYRCIGGPIVNQLDELRAAISEVDYQRRSFVKGDRVVVVRGRKVPIGTAGRVAWVSSNTGGVLVKDEDCWQTRDAAGTWVDPRNLEKLAEQ
jgi:hypothetical protein